MIVIYGRFFFSNMNFSFPTLSNVCDLWAILFFLFVRILESKPVRGPASIHKLEDLGYIEHMLNLFYFQYLKRGFCFSESIENLSHRTFPDRVQKWCFYSIQLPNSILFP